MPDPFYIKRGRRYEPAPHIIKVDPLIAICAFRYALGRRTYVAQHVAGWLIATKGMLRNDDAALIVREIDDQMERFGLGDECDKREWMRVRKAMAQEIAG